MARFVGIDFGTTNSVVSLLDAAGELRTLRFGPDKLAVFRSILCFWQEEDKHGEKLHRAAGQAAIAAYLDDALGSRLIMSMKTYLAQRSFADTKIFDKSFSLEELVAMFLQALLADAGDIDDAVIVAGRPVKFAGESAEDMLGEERLREAFALAGFPSIEVALEPEGAGYKFVQGLSAPATVLIGDFGGGTSDFSLLRFTPGQRQAVEPLAYAGVGIAGDMFDYRLIDKVIAPLLGKGDMYRTMGKELPVPAGYYYGFAHWHRLSLLRTPRLLREMEEVARGMENPERLRTLIELIEDETGYALYQAVSATKALLSSHDAAPLRFQHNDFMVDTLVERRDFEQWIADDLRRLNVCVDQALAEAALQPADIDHVFLTGGTSFVPAVRQIFADKFGAGKISSGAEFVSVAEGLALIGRDRVRQGLATIPSA